MARKEMAKDTSLRNDPAAYNYMEEFGHGLAAIPDFCIVQYQVQS